MRSKVHLGVTHTFQNISFGWVNGFFGLSACWNQKTNLDSRIMGSKLRPYGGIKYGCMDAGLRPKAHFNRPYLARAPCFGLCLFWLFSNWFSTPPFGVSFVWSFLHQMIPPTPASLLPFTTNQISSFSGSL